MPETKDQISDSKIKQIFLLAVILILVGLVCYNLAMFVPAVLGAVTLYIVSRKYNLYLQEEKEWKPWVASLVIILGTLILLILPLYFLIDVLVEKLGNVEVYTQKFNIFLDKIHDFIFQKIHIDILSKENLAKIKAFAGNFSTTALSGTFNTLTVIASILFFISCWKNRGYSKEF